MAGTNLVVCRWLAHSAGVVNGKEVDDVEVKDWEVAFPISNAVLLSGRCSKEKE